MGEVVANLCLQIHIRGHLPVGFEERDMLNRVAVLEVDAVVGDGKECLDKDSLGFLGQTDNKWQATAKDCLGRCLDKFAACRGVTYNDDNGDCS